MTHDIATVIENLQKELQSIRDLALVAPTAEQKEAFVVTAELLEKCIRDFDRHI
jgi:hypothetical protein